MGPVNSHQDIEPEGEKEYPSYSGHRNRETKRRPGVGEVGSMSFGPKGQVGFKVRHDAERAEDLCCT